MVRGEPIDFFKKVCLNVKSVSTGELYLNKKRLFQIDPTREGVDMKIVQLLVALLLASTSALSAEYVVKTGDSLSEIRDHLGRVHSVRQLADLNGINDLDRIYPGQRIKYLTEFDIAKAGAWAFRRVLELPFSDVNFQHFLGVIGDIEHRHFRFSIDEPAGTHANSILAYAEAQGEVCRLVFEDGEISPWRDRKDVDWYLERTKGLEASNNKSMVECKQ
jgi:LysM repeat protein